MAIPAQPPPNTGGAENKAGAWRENLNTRLICPDCREDPPNLHEFPESADTVCGTCGIVLSERNISYESEWRTFNSDEGKGDDPNRVGEADNELLTGSNTGTLIGSGGGKASKEVLRLKRAQSAQQDSKVDKILTGAYQQIDAWGERSAIPLKVRNSAKAHYKRTFDAGMFKGKNTEIVLSSCLFLACREHALPRSFNEMFQLTGVSKKDIGRTYKQLEKFLLTASATNIKKIEDEGGIVGNESKYKSTHSTKPDQLCVRFCNMLGLPFRVQTVAEGLAKQMGDIAGLAGRSPLSTASACTYMASHLYNLGKSVKEISEVAGVSDATIKHAYKFLYAERVRLVKPEWLGAQVGGTLNGDMKNLPAGGDLKETS